MAKTVCIIGAGVGGLTAGAYLVKEGFNVTVLEKAATAGWYIRRNRLFPTGATIAFGLEEKGPLKRIIDELQLELPMSELSHPMDVVLSDRSISIYKNSLLWEEELTRNFPDRSDDILQFWEELTRISDDVYAVTLQRAALPIQKWYDLGDLPQYAVTSPRSMIRLARYARWTVEDLLRKYQLEQHEPFRRLLNVQLVDAVQTDVSQAALLPSSLALAIYRKGCFHVENGMGQLSEGLADRIVDLGGKIILSSPVHQIQYDHHQKRWEVDSKKHSSPFDLVINNTGISFGPGTSHAEQNEFSWGAFRVDAIVKKQLLEKELKSRPLPFAYQIAIPPKLARLFGDEHGPLYVTFHETIDRNGREVGDEITMTASIHTNPENWLSYSREEYKQKKEQLLQVVLAEIEKVISVKEHLLYAEAGTPLTYEKFVGKAEVGGFPLTVQNAILKPKSIRSSLPNLYIVGEQAFPGPGTLSSALSGYFAARAIMKETRQE